MNQIKRNIIDNDDDSFDEEISWCEENLIKLIIIICLTMIAIGCAIALAMVLIKQMQRERALQAKKNTWSARLEECAPILKVAGPIIMNIIKVAFSLILI
jgi:flagellar basal body-associated protein FliL